MSSSDSESGSSSSSSSEDERSKKKRSAPDVGASSKVTIKEKSHKEAKKQRKSSPETDSSDENDKKGKKETKESSKNLSVDLGRNRLVTLSEFRGRISVDIREYYEKDGKQLPGKKGISLTPDEWNKLKKNVGRIDAALGKKA